MTHRNKIKLMSSVLLALLVILSAIAFALSSTSQNAANNASRLLIAIIILASISSVFVVYFTTVQKRKYEKLLNEDYFKEYEILKDAVANSQLAISSKKEVNGDLLDILLSAQEAGKSVHEVVGNPERFAREILLSYARPTQLAILSFLDSLIAFVLLVIGASLFLWLEETQQSFFAIRLDIAMVVFFILVAFVLLPVTRKQTATKNPWTFFLPIAIGILFVLLAELLRAFFYNLEVVKQFLDGTFRMIPDAGFLTIYVLSIPVFLLLKKIFRNRSWRG
jgi:DNA-binding ferritin-like protein (Dps family)